MSNDTQDPRPLAHLRQADNTDETVTYLHGRLPASTASTPLDDLRRISKLGEQIEEGRILVIDGIAALTEDLLKRTTSPLAITYADPGDLPDQYADIQRQVGAAIEHLRQWYPQHRIVVAPRFIWSDGLLSLTWDINALIPGSLHHPHSYGKATLAEALAEMRQQMRRYADLETVNAQLQDAAFEEALWCHEAVVFDWNDTQH